MSWRGGGGGGRALLPVFLLALVGYTHSWMDWDSDIVATAEQKALGEKDALHIYFNQSINDEQVFPSWEEMEKRVGEFEDVSPERLGNHDYANMTAWLRRAHLQYPQLTRLYSAGKSVQGRDLWVLLVSPFPHERPLLMPEVKIVGNMHGNEVVGREACLYLIDVLLHNYGKNVYLTRLVQSMRIHIMPSMNPDGYEVGYPGDRMGYQGRSNANNIDLNRNFPARHPEHKEMSGGMTEEPETLAVMKWFKQYPFILSTNLHGGSLVANYPWDDSETGADGVYSPSPDDRLFVMLAYRYARAHSNMWKTGRRCGLSADGDTFLNGITNGAGWYHLAGGMQDWQYVHTNAMEVTVEMGCFKFPTDDMYRKLWDEHKFSLIAYLETAMGGVRGQVTDAKGVPIANATVTCTDGGKKMTTTERGEFWRLLPPGEHTLVVEADSLGEETVHVTVRGVHMEVHNVTLRTCGEAEQTATFLKRGRGKVRVGVLGSSARAKEVLRQMAMDMCLSESAAHDGLSIAFVPDHQEKTAVKQLADFSPQALLVVSEGPAEVITFSAGEKTPPLFHSEDVKAHVERVIGDGKIGDCDRKIRERNISLFVDDLQLTTAFEVGVSVGCAGSVGVDAMKRAVETVLMTLRSSLSVDAVSEHSVLPSAATPLDHFTPKQAELVTAAAVPIWEEERKCAKQVPHPQIRIEQMGSGLPPYTLVMAIEKKTEIMVYEMASEWCGANASKPVPDEVQSLLSSGTLIFVPEIPHTQLNCHDYGTIEPFAPLVREIQRVVPQIDYVVMFAMGGMKVRWMNATGGPAAEWADAYAKRHMNMQHGMTGTDVCAIGGYGLPTEREIKKEFVDGWGKMQQDTTWSHPPDALLVQAGCCYESDAGGTLYEENKWSIIDMIKARQQGLRVRTDNPGHLQVSIGGRRWSIGQATFIPLSWGEYNVEVYRDGSRWTEFAIKISPDNRLVDKWFSARVQGSSVIVVSSIVFLVLLACCFCMRARLGAALNRRGLFRGSKEGFERIPLYMSEEEDEDEVVDFSKL